MGRAERTRRDMHKFFKSEEFKADMESLCDKAGRGHMYSEEYDDDQLLKLYNEVTNKKRK